jgi:hypothetical protein
LSARRSDAPLERCLAALREHGLLLAIDKKLPSVTTLVAGEPIAGSWWGHPAGRAIFHVKGELEDHEDVRTTRLVNGKVTYVERRLWPALLAVGLARDAWQSQGLSRSESTLLDLLDEQGAVRIDEVAGRLDAPATELGRELEARLLAVGGQVHTETGAHARTLTSWRKWAKANRVKPTKDVAAARASIEAAAASLGPGARLPWPPTRRTRGR